MHEAPTLPRPKAEPVSLGPNLPHRFYEALHHHPDDAPIIVDFDETLWLRNSTEEFLDSVRPRWLAAMVLQLLGFVQPWRLLQRGQPNHYRDWIRVVAVLIVAPWSLWLWRRKAADLGPRFVNRPLYDALRSRPREELCVVSFGFREIIQPLLSAIDRDLPLRESCRLSSGARLRKEGKASALRRDIGADELRRALIITDSETDRDLLDASDNSFLIPWPEAQFRQAGLRPLMPLVYLVRVKRPDERYVRHAILGHDLPVLLLAFALASTEPLLACGAILIYLLGFFTAYETGYHENDRLGLLLERKPKVSANYHALGHNFSPTFAWSVATILTGLASLVAFETLSWIPAKLGLAGAPAFLAVWGAFLSYLVFMRLLFRWQNVIAPKGRIVPMLGLQVGRTLGYALVLPTTVVGALLCAAHGVARWLPYVVYRFGGERKGVPNHLNAFLLMLLFAGAVAIGGGSGALLSLQALLIFAYTGLRAAKDLLSFRGEIQPKRIEPEQEVVPTKIVVG
ncbi:haloacid dehalogenase-like hydrolase [Sphingomonas sp. LHG3406-1]|uniref:haloacid dehalogenase-like hydrolase n=1 Tax=Sphingomonas sp. LHG3406-1 TaxID=2804617 RepID=UPI002619E6E4|nr:haloacid dehalogenase-like hydrolase [Sphingomonas sp. LHG3406-1]